MLDTLKFHWPEWMRKTRLRQEFIFWQSVSLGPDPSVSEWPHSKDAKNGKSLSFSVWFNLFWILFFFLGGGIWRHHFVLYNMVIHGFYCSMIFHQQGVIKKMTNKSILIIIWLWPLNKFTKRVLLEVHICQKSFTFIFLQ